MNNGIAESAWHIFVNLRDNHSRALRAREGYICGYSERAVSFFVGFADVEKRYIDRYLPAAEKERHFAQESRDRVRYTFPHRFA